MRNSRIKLVLCKDLTDLMKCSSQTNEEFRQMMNGYKPRAEKKVKRSWFMKPNFLNVPSSVDWRERGYVTPVKYQVTGFSPFHTSNSGKVNI